MRHGRNNVNRLSRRSEHGKAMLDNTARNVIVHGRIRTTLAKAKATQRVVDRLITLGKEGSIHSRRRAFRVLQDRTLVKQLFGDIAPRFVDVRGGYTRVLRLAIRQGDGAQTALLELTRLPVEEPAKPAKASKAKAEPAKPAEPEAAPSAAEQEAGGEKPKKFFEGLRELFKTKKGT